jgi:hypothetical protein
MKLVHSALFVLLLPTIAAAQNSGVYIQAGPLADILFNASAEGLPVDTGPLSSSSSTYTWNDLGGIVSFGFPSVDVRTSRSRVAPGASAAVGVFITPSVSLRLEGSFQGEQVTTSETSNLLFSTMDRQATAISDIVVAAGWHQGGARRTTITYLGGMVFRRQREEASFSYRYLPRILPTTIGPPGNLSLPPFSFEDEFGATTYSAGIMAGVDVTISFSRHLAVVPQLRMVAANHAWNVRPGVALQWRP